MLNRGRQYGWVAALALLGWLAPASQAAIGVTATGGWTLTLNSANLVAGAGSDLTGSYQSAANAALLGVTGAGGSASWHISVHRADTLWNAALTLSLQRTGNGSGGTVSGGTSYQSIGLVDTTFFSGTSNVSSIPVQFQLAGLSVKVPVNNYSTTVTFTVTSP